MLQLTPEGIDMSFNSLLINTVIIKNETFTTSGEPAAAVQTSEKARIEYKNKIVRDFKGEEKLSEARIFLKANTVAVPESLIIYDGREHTILSLTKAQDAHKIHHIEIYVR
jgi:hypothetical protein